MEATSIAASVVSVAIALLAIWLSVTFYRMSNDSSNRVHEAAKDISAAVIRLEKVFDRLYSDTFSMMRETVTDMRKHMWPEEPEADAVAIEIDRRTDEKVQGIREELSTKIDEVVKRSGLTDARVGELREQFLPMLEQAISKTRSAENEAREEGLRTSLLRRHMLLQRRKGEVVAEDLVSDPPGGFSPSDVVQELERLRSDGRLDWDDPILGPMTVIRRPPSRRPRNTELEDPHG